MMLRLEKSRYVWIFLARFNNLSPRRVLPKSMSAEVQITLRTTSMSDPSSRVQAIPLEPFSVNKDMGRILIRRSGETIAAGM